VVRSCSWCGQSFDAEVRPGPSPRYCRPSHRQRAYEARQKAKTSSGNGSETVRDVSLRLVDAPLSPVALEKTPRHAGPDLAFRILGPLQVVRARGERVDLSPELRAVLALLILRPRQIVSVEAFIDALWPDVDDRVARRRLHTAVWKLRKVLDVEGETRSRPLIGWSAPGYVLYCEDRQLDWVRFRRLRLAAEDALREGSPHLARTYLFAALSLWIGTEALSNVDVPARDLGFVAEGNAGRESAARCLVEACFQIGEHDRVIPELEARVAMEPLDDEAVAHLAVAYYRSGNPQRALGICRRYLDRWADDDSARPAPLITDLHTSILRRDVDIGGPTLRSRPTVAQRPLPGQGAFFAGSWSALPPDVGVLPAELVLSIAECGGRIHSSTDSSVEASFSALEPAIDAAIALHRSLGVPSPACIGIDVPRSGRVVEAFEGPPLARARLLAIAAREGQVLVSANGDDALTRLRLPEVMLRPLGSHRLNALSHPAPVFQLETPFLASSDRQPLWFDHGSGPTSKEDAFALVGRDLEVAEINNRLGEARLVTLVGAPGSGKTKLAGHVADGLAREYRDGVSYVALHPLSQPGMVAPTIAEILRLPRPAALHRDALFRSLRDRNALLVLDNCEHLLSECCELIDGLLGSCPEISVLATSREPLGSRFEALVMVRPLDPPPLGPLEAVVNNAAVILLRDRLAADDLPSVPNGTPPPEEILAMARICRAVDGVPLALVLAAARAKELGTDHLARALEETLGGGKGLRLLSGPSGSNASTSLDMTMEWSYELLDEAERELFECLAVFRAGFDIDEAAAVCSGSGLCRREDVEAGMDRLVRASLVTSEDGSRRFRLLQPVRDFASRKLAANRRRATRVSRQHAHHFLSMAEAAEPHLRGSQDRATVDRLDESLPDLYAAIRWAIDHGEATTALKLAGSMWVLWLVRGRIIEGWQMLEATLELDAAPTPERAQALAGCARLAWFGGDLNRTLECNREILAIAEMTGNAWAWALSALGFAAVQMFGSGDDGVPLRIEEVMTQFYSLGNDWETGMALQTLGGAAWHRGQYERAEKAQAETAAIFRAIGHPTLMSSLRVHGLMLALLGDIEAGIAEVEKSMISSYEASDLAGLAEALCCRAAIARYAGRHDISRHYYRDALRAARDAGQVWMIQWALGGLGNTEQLGLNVPSERLEDAVQVIARAEVLGRETGITMAPREREARAFDLEKARAVLGEGAFEAALARGRAMNLPDVIELALSLERSTISVA